MSQQQHTIPSASSTGVRPEDVPSQTLGHVPIVVTGAGFGGIAMAAALRRAGINDFVLVERGSDVGGTWRDNTYPGCACDVPSQLYSLSFAQNPEWSRTFAGQPEIHAYLRQVVEDFDLRANLWTDTEVLECRWDEEEKLWVGKTNRGTFSCDVAISACGAFADPVLPDVPGLEEFTGEVFHSAVWNHDLDLTGNRVAVIGTGASTIQFLPQIAPRVERLHLLQRSAPWVIPRPERDITRLERSLFARIPLLQKLVRLWIYSVREGAAPVMTYLPVLMNLLRLVALWNIRRAIKDPVLRRKVTPKYQIGCKRVLLSHDYYPALARENVEVLDSALARLTPTGVVTADGHHREVDVVVFGTGFAVNEQVIARRIFGVDGRRLSDQFFEEGQMALRSATYPGFPNLFTVFGPNAGLGHTSIVYMIESQVTYVLDALRKMEAFGIKRLEPRRAAVEKWNDTLQHRMRRSVWVNGGCRYWYTDRHGKIRTLWPGYTFVFRRATRRVDLREYQVEIGPGGRRPMVLPEVEPITIDLRSGSDSVRTR